MLTCNCRIQEKYVTAAVETHYEDMRQTVLSESTGEDVILAGDGRNDSPGYSAQYLTYTLMNHKSKAIISLKVVDCREAELKSVNMEKIGFETVMEEVRASVTVKEVVTDAHTQIKSLMSKSFIYFCAIK